MTERFKPGDVRNSSKVYIFDAGNNILGVKRAADDPARAGFWDLPGGEAELLQAENRLETPTECAARETYEETSFRFPHWMFRLVAEDTSPSAKGPHLNHRSFFRVDVGSFRPRLSCLDESEHETSGWLNPELAALILGTPLQKETVWRAVGAAADAMVVSYA